MSMDEALYVQVRAVFLEAAGLIPAELGPFLDVRCAGLPEVRRQVEDLLGYVSDEAIIGAPPADDPLQIVGATLAMGCRVEQFVAEGGFSHVYRGHHPQRGAVAIKLFKQSLTARMHADLEASFRREGALMAQLSAHTEVVVRAFAVGSWRDPRGRAISYTIMEWLDGQPLDQVLAARREPMPIADVIAQLDPIARALSAAHAAGVAHRDLKPENIFATPAGMRLLDFGVAKIATHLSRGFEATGSALSPVTVQYAAPEQVTKRLGATGPATDVHGLALVCVEMLAGRRPYETRNARAALLQVLATRRPTPRALGVEVPAAVEKVFAQALALAPADRHADVATFWAALNAAAQPAPRRRWPWRRS
jgi:serine/threonine protein kinase